MLTPLSFFMNEEAMSCSGKVHTGDDDSDDGGDDYVCAPQV